MTEESFMWRLNIFQLCFPFCIEMDLAVSDGGGWLGLPQEMNAQKLKHRPTLFLLMLHPSPSEEWLVKAALFVLDVNL